MYNKYYDDVTINHDTIAQFPIDCNLTNLIMVRVSSDELEVPVEQDDPYNSHIQSTFVPTIMTGVTEQQAIHQSVMHRCRHVRAFALLSLNFALP